MLGGAPSPTTARVFVALAAVLWSLGSFFMRVLKEPTVAGLESPLLTPLQIAFFRGLFAGAFLIPLVRRRDVCIRPVMLAMVGCFGLMSGLYLSALGLGSAANAIFLQNTAPFWVYLIGVYLLGEAPDRRSGRAILIGMAGALVILVGNWPKGLPSTERALQAEMLLTATASGVAYAGVILFLRGQRDYSTAWLTTLNLLGSAAAVGVFMLARQVWYPEAGSYSVPSGRQFGFLAVFGAVQMAVPYWLFARGLRTIGPQEAGLITLLEPVLNPVWAYLVTPETEVPTVWTVAGGVLLLAALVWRYVPTGRPTA